MTNQLEINPRLCMSIKNKNSKIQCTRKRNHNSDYCGIHKRAKHIIRIDELLSIDNTNVISDPMDIDTPIISKSEYYNENDILNKKINDLRLSKLKKTFFHLNLKLKISKIKKHDYYNALKKHFTTQIYYKDKLKHIITIQKYYRGYHVRKRSKCVNDTELYTGDSIYDIPIAYFTILRENGLIYGFDLRTVLKMIDINEKANKKITNPYTLNMIDFETLLKWDYEALLLRENNKSLMFDFDKKKVKYNVRQHMVDIFQEFDMLGNYTDYRWFEDLNMYFLKKLYKKCEDVWNYRAQIPNHIKRKIVKDGKAFDCNRSYINRMNNKTRLQKILLDEFERFVTEGETEDDKRLGVNLILTALVEVSIPAARALPHLVQFNFD